MTESDSELGHKTAEIRADAETDPPLLLALLDIRKGSRVKFLHGTDYLTGVVNGSAMLNDGNLYVPVYVSEGDRCLIVHSSNLSEVG